MSCKHILLALFLFFYVGHVIVYQQSYSSLDWLKSFFITPQQEQKQKKFAIAVQKGTTGGKPLDLLEFYKAKEEKTKEAPTTAIAKSDAEKFKKAVQENSSIMKWLKNN